MTPSADRFPGFHVLNQAGAWDSVTRAVVEARVGRPSDIRFFDADEEATATALFDRLLDQDPEHRVPVTAMVDARLAEQQTDGWRYDSMPSDEESWRRSLAALEEDAAAAHGRRFATCATEEQLALLQQIKSGDGDWHGFDRSRIWSLWTRYACTAFYSHPDAWDEIGFAGPAYPRGYKNLGIDRREPFEVADTQPDDMPRTGTAGS